MRLLACALAAFATAAAPAAAASAVATAPARVVVLVSVDDWNARHIGAYGYERPTSPRFDRLAAKATLFTRSASASTWTLPSHMALLTSVLPSDQGIIYEGGSDQFQRSLRPGTTTLAQALRAEGYDGGPEESHKSLRPGVTTLAEALKAEGFSTAGFVAGLNLSAELGFSRGFDLYAMDVHAPGSSQTDKALAWLARAPGRRFVFLHYYDLHAQLDNPRLSPTRGAPIFACPAPAGRAFLPAGAFVAKGADLRGRGGFADERVRRSAIAEYDGCVRSVDGELGRLEDGLRRLGLLDETLLIVTSDHGERFGEFGAFSHQLGIDPAVLRVPLLVKWPGQKRGRRVRALASGLDVVPTVLAAAAPQRLTALSRQIQGVDLAVLARSGRRPGAAFAENTDRMRAAIDEDGWELEQDLGDGRLRLASFAGTQYEPVPEPLASEQTARLRAYLAGRYRQAPPAVAASSAAAPSQAAWPPAGFGLVSDSTAVFVGQTDAAWGAWPRHGSQRNVIGSSDGLRARFRAFPALSQDQARRRVRLQLTRLSFLYPKPAYPGMVTRFPATAPLAPKVEPGAGPGGFDLVWANATRRLTYGAGTEDLVAYRAALTFLYCEGSRRLYEVELFYPKASFDADRARRDLADLRCAD